MKNLTVAISIITYNHEKYIIQCLESILEQKTDFSYKIFITDDCSSDRTKKICKEYSEKYPNIIDFEGFDKNIGSMMNFIYNLNKCKKSRAKYVAICDGDDYWIDKEKLQKQVEVLENNLDIKFSLGKYLIFDQNKKSFNTPSEKIDLASNNIFTLKDYLSNKFSQTSTFLFRNDFEIPEWMESAYLGDQSLVVVVVGDSKIYYHRDDFSVYRVHTSGISSNISAYKRFEKYIYFFRKVNEHTNRKYYKIIFKRFLLSLPMFFKLFIAQLILKKNRHIV